MDSSAFQIQYCEEHYDELVQSLIDCGLAPHMASTQEDLIEKLQAGKSDPHLEASTAITSSAISLFGAQAVMDANGCPLCAFSDILAHVSNHLAIKYRGTH